MDVKIQVFIRKIYKQGFLVQKDTVKKSSWAYTNKGPGRAMEMSHEEITNEEYVSKVLM